MKSFKIWQETITPPSFSTYLYCVRILESTRLLMLLRGNVINITLKLIFQTGTTVLPYIVCSKWRWVRGHRRIIFGKWEIWILIFRPFCFLIISIFIWNGLRVYGSISHLILFLFKVDKSKLVKNFIFNILLFLLCIFAFINNVCEVAVLS